MTTEKGRVARIGAKGKVRRQDGKSGFLLTLAALKCIRSGVIRLQAASMCSIDDSSLACVPTLASPRPQAAVEALLGPKTEADLAPPEPKKKVKAAALPPAAKVGRLQGGGS